MMSKQNYKQVFKKKNRYMLYIGSYYCFVTNSGKALRPCLQGSRVALLQENG